MRKICAVLISTLLILTAGQALAYNYNGPWEVNDLDAGDFFALTIATVGGTATLSMYDNNPNISFAILDNKNPTAIPSSWYAMGMNMVTVYVFDVGGNWYADFDKTIAGAYALGATPEFKFMFTDSVGPLLLTNYDVTSSGSDSYVLAATDPTTGRPVMSVVVSDVTPVPIPGAVLLLGSGLIGLIGIRRRPRRS